MTKSTNNKKPLIILTAGGTGGHVYPAEALAEELLERGYELMLITDKRGKDNYKGKLGEIRNIAVLSGGIVGKSKLFKVKSLCKTAIGIIQATFILWREKPQCVVGFGGYASFPASMAAILSGTDLVIHEQNSVMSRTNRFLSRYAELIAQSFRQVKYAPNNDKNILCGMPIRSSIASLFDNSYPSCNNGKMQLLILGGSQGAKIFGEVIPQAIKKLDEKITSNLTIYQQCRMGEEREILSLYKGVKSKVIVKHFFDNMAELYASSNIIITRSGASSISEIAASGVPSILVPLPTAADDHQTSNAAELSTVGGGAMIKQSDFNADKLKDILEEWIQNPDKLEKMSIAAKNVAIVDASKRLANAIENRIIKHRGDR